MIDYTVNQIITSVQQRAMNPTNQNLFLAADIVRIASEELQSNLIPLIESVKEEYWATNQDIPFVQGTFEYLIPERCTGLKLRDVYFLDNQNNPVNLNRLNPEDLKSSWAFSPYQFGFYPRDNKIVLVLGNVIGSANYQFLRMVYFRRPNVLCTTDQAGQILNINPGAQQITLSFAPPTWTNAALFDVINSKPPFDSKGDNLAISNIAGFVLTFTNPLPTNLAVGDWVSEAGFSPIPQVPPEAHRYLEAVTAARILQYSGDPTFQMAQAQAEQIRKDLIMVISPRVDGSSRKIPNKNRLWGFWSLLAALAPIGLLIK